MVEYSLLAKKYAQAFFNLHKNSINENDLNKLTQIVDFFKKNKRLIALLKVPHINEKDKIAALQDILINQYKLPVQFLELITVLVQQKRAWYIPEVLLQLNELYQKHALIESFVITSSHQLDENQLSFLQKFLKKITGHTIIYRYTIDPSLIAGIRMKSNHLLWEYSIAQQLRNLSRDNQD